MRSLRKRIPTQPSALLENFADEIVQNAPYGPIADIACGFGRNAFFMASKGATIICVDQNAEALKHINTVATQNNSPISTRQIDLINDSWPFKSNSLGAIINVHFYSASIIDHFVHSLMPNGYLYLETIDNRGGNYHSLPQYGYILGKIKPFFKILHYVEKKAGPDSFDAATLKLLAKKYNN